MNQEVPIHNMLGSEDLFVGVNQSYLQVGSGAWGGESPVLHTFPGNFLVISLEETGSHPPLVPYLILDLGSWASPVTPKPTLSGLGDSSVFLSTSHPWWRGGMGLGVGEGSKHFCVTLVGFCAQT